MDTKLEVVLCCTLMVLLQSVNVFSATSPCGATQCDDVGGECNRDVCYCKPLFFDATCSTACAACAAPTTDACDAAATCTACGTACTNGGTCAAVGAAGGTVECKCPDTFTGATCQYACSALTCTVYEKCQPNPGDTAAECGCKGGLSGADCKAVIDCAQGQPCMNGGSCATSQCNCAAGYVGKICQHDCPTDCTSRQECAENSAETAAECSCKAGLSGENCATVACGTTNPCLNGGTCSSNSCACPTNTVGLLCQLKCSPTCTKECIIDNDTAKCSAPCLLASWIILVFAAWASIAN